MITCGDQIGDYEGAGRSRISCGSARSWHFEYLAADWHFETGRNTWDVGWSMIDSS